MHRQGTGGSGACHLVAPWDILDGLPVSRAGAFKSPQMNIHQSSINLPSFWHFEHKIRKKTPFVLGDV